MGKVIGRFRFSERYKSSWPRRPHDDAVGDIVGESYDKTCWRVHRDGTAPSTLYTFHKSFIEVTSWTSTPLS